jgi:hypothetical protein
MGAERAVFAWRPGAVDDATTSAVLVAGGVELASLSLAPFAPPDLDTVDELARMQLAAGRLGLAIELRNPCPRLVALLDLTGLDQVLPVAPTRRRSGRAAR